MSAKSWLPLLLLLAVAVGCSGEARSGRPDEPAPQPLEPAAPVVTPLDAYLPTRQESMIMRKAEARLTNRCLRSLGYRSNPLPEPTVAPADEAHPEFIVIPLEQARRYGYNQPPQAVERGIPEWDRKSSKTQQDLLRGVVRKYNGKSVPEGGCVRKVADAITQGTRVPSKITGEGVELTRQEFASPTGLGEAQVQVIRLEAVSKASRDARALKVVERWSECMREEGYLYSSPQDAANDDRWNGDEAGATEKAAATADARCRTQVGYLDTMVQVQSIYEIGVISSRKSELSTLENNIKKWVSNASDSMQSGGS
ncbi:hypothetical protein [Streptomyces sp. NPDC055287]